MSIKTRRLLFYSFVLLFLLVGGFLVLSSRGYHLDWKTLQLEATGGIYISSIPPRAQIELDDKSINNKAGLLQRGTLIDNLASDTYRVRVTMEGHSTWSKDAPVASGAVTVFDSIILVPDDEPVGVASSTAREMKAAGRHLALEAGGGITLNGTDVLGHEVISLSESGTLLTRSTQTGNYYLANAFEPDENLNVSLTFNNLKENLLKLPGAVSLKKVLPYPYNDRRFIVSTDRAIYLLDTQRLSLEQIALGPNDFYIQDQNTVAWIEDSQIKVFNLPLRTINTALDLGETNTSNIGKIQSTSLGWLVLNKSGRLLLFANSATPEVLAEAVVDFELSPSREQVAIVRGNNPLLVYDLEKAEVASVDLAGSIQDIAWFKDSAHLFALVGGNLIFTEVSSLTPLNQMTLSTGVYAFSYSQGQNYVEYSTPQGIFRKRII